MAVAALARKLSRLEALVRDQDRQGQAALEQLRADPARIMAGAGMTPDPWQEQLLGSGAARVLLLCSR
jgi:hypothetical protein